MEGVASYITESPSTSTRSGSAWVGRRGAEGAGGTVVVDAIVGAARGVGTVDSGVAGRCSGPASAPLHGTRTMDTKAASGVRTIRQFAVSVVLVYFNQEPCMLGRELGLYLNSFATDDVGAWRDS